MLKKLALSGFFLALAVFAGTHQTWAFSKLSIGIEEPQSPTNQTSFNINFVALDVAGNPVTVTCFKKGPSDGGFSSFATVILAAGGNSGNCPVTSSILSSNGTYQFYVSATDGTDMATSTTDSVDLNTSGPDTPTNYSKNQVSSCEYKISFRTANDGGKTVRVEIYRSTNTSFTLDNSTRVGNVSIGSNTNYTFDNTVPDCSKTYYYAVRAFDSAGNGSGWVGDNVTVTINNNPSTTPATGGGAIPVSGSNIPTGNNVLGQNKAATQEGGQALGESTPSPEVKELPNPTSKQNNFLWLLGLLVLLGLLAAAYVLYRRQQQSEV